MNEQFLEASDIHSFRKLHSTYQFSVDGEEDSTTVTVEVWELIGANTTTGDVYEAETSHTIQNSKQGDPYFPITLESSPEAAVQRAIHAFMNFYEGPSTTIKRRKVS